MKKRSVSILMFDEVEVLDFAGPFEVFSISKNMDDEPLFDVSTIAVTKKCLKARNGLQITADKHRSELTQTDILIVPGGMGTRPLVHHDELIDWIKTTDAMTELTLSVCTGALLLAKAGLLANQAATTHHHAFDLLAEIDPTIDIKRDERFVDNGSIVTSGGISAGIDMSFHVLEKLHGAEIANKTASYMEYRRV